MMIVTLEADGRNDWLGTGSQTSVGRYAGVELILPLKC